MKEEQYMKEEKKKIIENNDWNYFLQELDWQILSFKFNLNHYFRKKAIREDLHD